MPPEVLQLGNSGCRPTAAIEQVVDQVNQLPQLTKQRSTSTDSSQRAALGWSQMSLDPQVAVIPDILLQPSVGIVARAFLVFSRPASLTPRWLGKRLAKLGQRTKDQQVQLLDDVEDADLMPDTLEGLRDRLRIERGAVGGNSLDLKSNIGQISQETATFKLICFLGDLKSHSLVQYRINGIENAVRPIIDLVNAQVPAEVLDDPRFVVNLQVDLFPPPRPPSDAG